MLFYLLDKMQNMELLPLHFNMLVEYKKHNLLVFDFLISLLYISTSHLLLKYLLLQNDLLWESINQNHIYNSQVLRSKYFAISYISKQSPSNMYYLFDLYVKNFLPLCSQLHYMSRKQYIDELI